MYLSLSLSIPISLLRDPLPHPSCASFLSDHPQPSNPQTLPSPPKPASVSQQLRATTLARRRTNGQPEPRAPTAPGPTHCRTRSIQSRQSDPPFGKTCYSKTTTLPLPLHRRIHRHRHGYLQFLWQPRPLLSPSMLRAVLWTV